MAEIYVVMWEMYDDYKCTGGDLFMSLDHDNAMSYLGNIFTGDSDLIWENDMLIRPIGRYGWEKYYIITRPLDEEL
jgi:hypothetical protein